MTVTLRQPLTLAEWMTYRRWRNAPDVIRILRSKRKSVLGQLCAYPRIANRPAWLGESQHWYYAVCVGGLFVGVTGLTYIEAGEAEISLLLGPDYRGVKIGRWAIDVVLDEAWRRGLRAVTGECYPDGAVDFWHIQASRHGAVFELKPIKRPSLSRPELTHSWQWTWVRP